VAQRPPWELPVLLPVPVLSFVLTAFLSPLLGTFAAIGVHQTLVEPYSLGESSTQAHVTAEKLQGEIASQIGQSQIGQSQIGQSQIGQSQIGQSQIGQSQDANDTGSTQSSTEEGQPGDARTNATGNATRATNSSAIASQQVASGTLPVYAWPMPLSVSLTAIGPLHCDPASKSSLAAASRP